MSRGWNSNWASLDTRGDRPGEYPVTGNAVVLGVALLTWVLLFVYLLRIERRVKDMERR